MITSIRFATTWIVVAVLSASGVYSQTPPAENTLLYQTGDPGTWSPDQDAVASAPTNHTILLENDRVRVLEVTLWPREVEPLHHHRWPSVLYILEAGDFIDRDAQGNTIMDTRELPEPLQFPLTMWKDSEAPHSVENLSDTQPIRLIRVELKPQL